MQNIFLAIARFIGMLPTLTLTPARTRRGAGLLEYALVMLISIAIFTVLYQLFPGFFRSLVVNIGNRINGVTS